MTAAYRAARATIGTTGADDPELPVADPYDVELARFIISWVPFGTIPRDAVIDRFGIDIDQALTVVLRLAQQTAACLVVCDDGELLRMLRIHRTRLDLSLLAHKARCSV